MKKDKDFLYYTTLRDLVTFSLLHVLMEASISPRRIPRTTRNEMFIRFLKPKLKQSRWKPVKNEIKRLLEIARHKTGHLEERLYELNKKAQESSLGAHQFYDLLVHLNETENFGSLLYTEGDELEADILYIREKELTDCFNSLRQIKPLSMTVRTERIETLLRCIDKTPAFYSEIQETQGDISHFLLHSA